MIYFFSYLDLLPSRKSCPAWREAWRHRHSAHQEAPGLLLRSSQEKDLREEEGTEVISGLLNSTVEGRVPLLYHFLFSSRFGKVNVKGILKSCCSFSNCALLDITVGNPNRGAYW